MLTNESVCICQGCGVSMPTPATLGHCPSCLMQLGLNANSTPTQLRAKSSVFPRRFGDFELLREIGRGGMGVVYEARQISLNRTVALKLVLESLFSSPVALRRFEIEAEAAARLNHPNIVPIYEISHDDEQPFISMRLIPGESLAQRVSAGAYQKPVGDVSAKEAEEVQKPIVTLITKIARAVHYAHEHGVLHRDIKPGNILIDADGCPHLTDFGLAKLTDSDNNLSHTGAFFGTPNYMAPELAAGGQSTVGTDVYSLGAIFYELLTGKVPFKADSAAELLRQAAGTPPLRPRVLNPAIDRDLETICLKCLEKTSHQRYTSALAFAEDLERWERDEPVHARPIGPIVRTLRWTRRHAMRTALIASLLVGLVISLWLWSEMNARKRDKERAHKIMFELLGASGFWSNPNKSVPVRAEALALIAQIDSPLLPQNAHRIRVGLFVEEDSEEVILGYGKLFAELQPRLSALMGEPVLFDLQLYHKDHPAGIAGLISHEVDILKAGGHWFLEGFRMDSEIRPLVGQDPGKMLVVFALKTANILKISELKSRTIARSDGSIGMWGQFYLGKAGIPARNFTVLPSTRYDSNFDLILEAQQGKKGKKVTDIQPVLNEVLAGHFDAGIVQEKHFLNHPKIDSLVRLETFPSSRIYWIASSKLDPKVATLLTRVLVSLRDPKLFAKLPDKVKGYSIVSPEEIEGLKEAEAATQGDAE